MESCLFEWLELLLRLFGWKFFVIQTKVEMENLKDEITAKSEQIDLLEKQISNSFIASDKIEQSGALQVCSLSIIITVSLVFSQA